MNWRQKKDQELAISEAELVSMTSDLADAHRDTLPALHSSIDEWVNTTEEEDAHSNVSSIFSRRSFLARTGVLAAGGLVIAASGAAASTVSKSGLSKAFGEVPHTSASIDVEIAALAASLELLAVATYGAALNAAKAKKLGAVPPAVATFAETAMAQHKDHGAAWNAIVSSAGYQPMTQPNAKIGKTVNAAFAKVTNVAGVAKLALSLEDAAAATYLEAIGVVKLKNSIATAATIQPVEMQHAAILNFILGTYPVPSAYATTTGAATLSDLSGLKKKAS